MCTKHIFMQMVILGITALWDKMWCNVMWSVITKNLQVWRNYQTKYLETLKILTRWHKYLGDFLCLRPELTNPEGQLEQTVHWHSKCHRIPCKITIKIPCKITIKIPCKVTIKIPCKITIKIPCKITIKIPCKITIEIPCEITIKYPTEYHQNTINWPNIIQWSE